VIWLLRKHKRVGLCFFLFLCVFGIWQGMYYFSSSLPQLLIGRIHLSYLIVQVACIGVFVLFVRLSGTRFKEYGLEWPESYQRQISLGVLLVIIYYTITLFLPSFFSRTRDLGPPISFDMLPLQFLSALLSGIASETVFRGYILREFTKAYSFLPALCLSSLLYGLHMLQLPLIFNLDIIHIYASILSPFIAGLFLGYFLRKTKNLLGPMVFQTTFLLFHSIIFFELDIPEYTMLTLEAIAYSFILLLTDALAKESLYEIKW